MTDAYRRFERAYRDAFGCPPPRDFRQAWAVIEDAIYWGVQPQEESDGGFRKGKRPGEHWPLHEWRLIPAKGEAEKVLDRISVALHRWKVASQKEVRPPPRHPD